jgi:hypothetical protein
MKNGLRRHGSVARRKPGVAVGRTAGVVRLGLNSGNPGAKGLNHTSLGFRLAIRSKQPRRMPPESFRAVGLTLDTSEKSRSRKGMSKLVNAISFRELLFRIVRPGGPA